MPLLCLTGQAWASEFSHNFYNGPEFSNCTTTYGQVVVPNNTVAVWVMFLVTAIPVAFAIWTKLEERKTKQRNQELNDQNVQLALKVPPIVPGGRRASDLPATVPPPDDPLKTLPVFRQRDEGLKP